MSNWSYGNASRWKAKYPMADPKNNNKQSPINIQSNLVRLECGSKCELIIKYNPSKCYLTNDHNTITINYDPGSYIIYQNNWYELNYAKIHVPSLHAYDGEHYRAEINLYHCTDRQCDSGVIIAIPLDIGPDHGSAVNFLSQFINQAPTNDTTIEREVSVSPDWNIADLIPSDRTCFVYEGSLPHPPCTPGWTWIVFNHPANAGSTILKTLHHNIVIKVGENIRRPVPRAGNRVIYRIPGEWVKVLSEEPSKDTKKKIDSETKKKLQNAPWKTDENPRLLKDTYWSRLFAKYRKKIKGFLIFIMLILFIVLAIQLTKYLIRNDIINNWFVGKNSNSPNNTGNNLNRNPQGGSGNNSFNTFNNNILLNNNAGNAGANINMPANTNMPANMNVNIPNNSPNKV